MPPDDIRLIPLPWYRESAFRAWVKKTCTAVGGAFIGYASNALPEGVGLMLALKVAAIYSVGDLILSVPDIFFSGPDTYQQAPTPKP